MRPAGLPAFLVVAACSPSDQPACVPDLEHACVTWTWQFVAPQTGAIAACPDEIARITAYAQEEYRDETNRSYFKAAGSGEAPCASGELELAVTREADRSGLEIHAERETSVPVRTKLYAVAIEAVSVAMTDHVELALSIPDDLGYFDATWSVVDATGSPTCGTVAGAVIRLVATRSEDGSVETSSWPCQPIDVDSQLTHGLPPGTYTVTLQLVDYLGRIGAESSLADPQTITPHAEAALAPVVLTLP